MEAIAVQTIGPTVVSIATPPGSDIVGLAWGGNRLWASDRESKKILYFDNGTWVTLVPWDNQPGPLAWGANGLWIVDEEAGHIVRLDSNGDGFSRTTIPIPPTALRDPPAITGLAWDGSTLWLSTGCGLCSTIYQIDADRGDVLQSFFPSCIPRGLAAHQTGLWTVAYSGPRKQPFMSRRELSRDPTELRSQQDFFAMGPVPGPPAGLPSPPKDPTAIAIAADRYWVVDRDSGIVNAFYPDPIP
jgi:hypothetical protein